MDTRAQRTRRVMIAFAAIVGGAVAAFTVTMGLTTSYPSAAEPAPFARSAIEHTPTATAPPWSSPAERGSTTTSTSTSTPTTTTTTTPATTTPTDATDATGRATGHEHARGGVLVDDGSAPRSPGNLGALAKEDVKEGVAAVKDKVKDCYERALQIDDALGGTVKVSFTLEGNDEGKGVVTKGEIADSDMNSPFFEACVLKEIAAAEFKAPGGGGVVNVTYPFHFANADSPTDAGR